MLLECTSAIMVKTSSLVVVEVIILIHEYKHGWVNPGFSKEGLILVYVEVLLLARARLGLC